MSSRSQGRIKLIRKRSSSSIEGWKSIPIGADGILVDMVSELDLEEEIRLGGNHYVDIYETETSTIIKEWYFSEARGNRTVAEMSDDGLITFSGQVIITNAEETKITELHSDNLENENLLITEDNNFIVTRLPISSDKLKIIMELYRYDMDTEEGEYKGVLLHSKIIYIYENLSREIAIDEQVGYTGIDLIINPFELEELEGENGG